MPTKRRSSVATREVFDIDVEGCATCSSEPSVVYCQSISRKSLTVPSVRTEVARRDEALLPNVPHVARYGPTPTVAISPISPITFLRITAIS